MSQPLTLIKTSPQTPETPARPQTRRHSRLLAIGAAVVALAALSLLYAHVARSLTVNSDNASIVLEAADVLHGNLWLHGWTLANESFFTLDLPFHLAAVAWHGISTRVMHETPAVIYALTVLGAVWLAGRGAHRHSPWLGRALTFALIGLPSLLVPQVMLVGVGHAATALAMVGALVVLDTDAERGLAGPRRLAFGALCVLLVANDPMAVTLFIVPTVVVSLVRHFRRAPASDASGSKRPELVLAAVTLTSLLLGDVILKVISAAGGFQVTPLALKIVPLSALPTNALLLIQGLLSLFRADVFGEPVDAVTLGLAANLLGLGLVLWAMTRTLRAWPRWHEGDRVSQILGVTMALNLAALLFDKAVYDLYKTLTSPAERYLIPFFVSGAILAGRCGLEQIGSPACRKALAAALGTVAVSQFAAQWPTPPAEDRPAGLARWLAARGLRNGYGNYWCSSIVTAESGGAVRVRPVESRNGLLAGKRWFSDARWYRATPAHFLVYDIAQVGRRAFYFDDVNLQSATATFGPPTETDRTDGYTILVWDKNITPGLKR